MTFSDLVGALPEGRQFPQHSWKKVFDAVFLGAAMQIPGLLQIEAACRQGAPAHRIEPISDDTIGYALERQSPEPVFALNCEIARRLKRNGVVGTPFPIPLGLRFQKNGEGEVACASDLGFHLEREPARFVA